MFELIVLALITYFIIKKLKSVLGEESDEVFFGYDATKHDDKIKDAEQIDTDDDERQIDDFKYLSEEAKSNIDIIREKNENFSLLKFIKISNKVLECVIKANNEQNKSEIRKFLSNELAELVCNTYNDDKKNNIFLVSIRETKIIDVIKNNSVFDIKVMFNTEQIEYVTDSNNEVIDGNKNDVISINEVWTFTHNFKEKNSTWFVTKIEEM